jgi:ABC-type polysaccharide/polyol phosphate export permease
VSRNRRAEMIFLLVLSAAVGIQLVSGVAAGLSKDWMTMSIFFFGTVLGTLFGTSLILGMILNSRFRRLENRFSGNHPIARSTSHQMFKGLCAALTVSVPALLFLSIISGLRRDWLWLSIYLVACAAAAIVCATGALILGINVRSRRLDELIRGITGEE